MKNVNLKLSERQANYLLELLQAEGTRRAHERNTDSLLMTSPKYIEQYCILESIDKQLQTKLIKFIRSI